MSVYFFIVHCFTVTCLRVFVFPFRTGLDFVHFWSLLNYWFDILNVGFLFWKLVLLPIVNEPEFIWFWVSWTPRTPWRLFRLRRSSMLNFETSIHWRFNPWSVSSPTSVHLKAVLDESLRIQIWLLLSWNLGYLWYLCLFNAFALTSETLLIPLRVFSIIINNANIILYRLHSLVDDDRIISDLAGEFAWATGQWLMI